VSKPSDTGVLAVAGLRLQDGGEALADLVIDAGGRLSQAIDWLAEAGASVPEEIEDCAILYFTRFYSLLPGQDEPPRGTHPASGDLGYLKFAVFPADNGTFSVTLAVPEVEEALRAAVVRPDVYEEICRSLPGVAPWTDPARSAPVSRVFGMGNLKSRWREMAPGGRSAALNFFCVGDSLVRTNPLYGRGCSFAAVEAHLLRDVIARTDDLEFRARLYSQRVRSELRPFYDDMAARDRSAATRALRGLDPAWSPSWRSRLTASFIEDGVAIAVRSDISLLRAASRGFHMLAPPRGWLARPGALLKVFAAWARGRRANAHLYAPKPGPPRLAMFAALSLPPLADLERISGTAAGAAISPEAA
jgi:flavin-dependent dehydrogenase